MGLEIDCIRFTPSDFANFKRRLENETALLAQYLQHDRFAQDALVVGFELEAWLIGPQGYPAPINDDYLARLPDTLVSPELSRFNVELNGTPQPLRGDALQSLETELCTTWRQCQAVAQELGTDLVTIGILPTVRERDLCLDNISPLNRYHALNEQVMRQRQGRPLKIHIQGRETLSTTHHDVMLEAATTSLQVHLQVPERQAVRYFNASLLASGPMVAASANSPFLFGRELWDETRIPLFEQAVDATDATNQETAQRVTFGSGYAKESLLELFQENLEQYPVLLPMDFPSEPMEFNTLRLHNGTIWRWNRPLIGFDSSGLPHFRIEHRVFPSGPSVVDQVANIAFYLGLVQFLATRPTPPEANFPFASARDNFYQAAQHSLQAHMTWSGNPAQPAKRLILDTLLPMAREGLVMLGLPDPSSKRYLDIIQARVDSQQTGAAWQKAFIENNDKNFTAMTANYLERQRSGVPVHEWMP